MARGKPDWGINTYQTAGDITDLGEVAARQSGIASIDGLGRTLFYDDFSGGRTRGKLILNGGATVFPTIKQQITETTTTTNIDGAGLVSGYGLTFPVYTTPGQQAALAYWIYLNQSRRIGIETCVNMFTSSMTTLAISLLYAGSGTPYLANLVYNPVNQQWTVEGSVINTMTTSALGWLQIKLVADFQTGNYIRAILGEERIDLSAIAMPTSGGSPVDVFDARISAVARAAATRPVVVAYVMITRDEP